MKTVVPFLFGLVFSMVFISATEGGTDDIWKKCSENEAKLQKKVGETTYTCCYANLGAGFDWQWVNQKPGDNTALCISPEKPKIISPDPGSWQTKDFSVFFEKFSATNNLNTVGNVIPRCEYGVSDDPNNQPSKWETLSCTDTSKPLTVGTSGACNVEGKNKCVIYLRANDGLNYGEAASRSFSIDYNLPSVSSISPTGACKDEQQEFTATVSDAGSGIKECRLIWVESNKENDLGLMTVTDKTTGGSCEVGKPCTANKPHTFTNSRLYELRATCKDNVDKTKEGPLTVINVGPVKTFVLGTPNPDKVNVRKLDASSTTGSTQIPISAQCGFADTISLSGRWIGFQSGQGPNGVTVTRPVNVSSLDAKFTVSFTVGPSASTGIFTYEITGTSGNKVSKQEISLVIWRPTFLINAQPSLLFTDEVSIITVTSSINEANVDVTLTTSLGTFGNGQNSTSCKTGANGVCTAQNLISSTAGATTITASAKDYNSATASVIFENKPTCSLVANPKDGQGLTQSTITVSYTGFRNAPGTVQIDCGTQAGNLDVVTASGCSFNPPGSRSGTCSQSCTYPVVQNTQTFTATASIQGRTCDSTQASVTVVPLCKPSLEILEPIPYFGTNDNLPPKHGLFKGEQFTWDLKLKDNSQFCTGKSFSIPSMTRSEKCRARTGVYLSNTDLNQRKNNLFDTIKPNKPHLFPVQPDGETNFIVFVESDRTNACTLTFNFVGPDGNIIDPSFTADPGSVSPQAPQVSFFAYTGDLNNFNVEWEAFYPNQPARKMEVKCGLNCDPDLDNCPADAGKRCLPYPFKHGPEELKKGKCQVPSPAYNFVQESLKCVFYDPDKEALRTTVNNAFKSIDFQISGPTKIEATVGQSVQLKVDIGNLGVITDSYKITLTADDPLALDISPSSATTGNIPSNEVANVFFSVLPIIDAQNKITVTVASQANPAISKTFTIDVSSALFTLPEFGLVGFIQILVIATIIYFLLFNRTLARKKRRK